MPSIVKASLNIQRGLSKLQSLPIIGPAIFSPVKLFVSIAQTIAGLASTIFFGVASMIFPYKPVLKATGMSIAFTSIGLFASAYSIANMLTLGMIGFTTEMPFGGTRRYSANLY